MGSAALAQGCELLLHFNSKPENFKALVQSWKESGIIEQERNIYRELDTAIEAFFKHHPLINRQDVGATNSRNLTSQVKAILDDVDSETRWKLLNYTLGETRYWLRAKSTRKPSVGAVPPDNLDFVSQPFYTICCCLAQIEPETPFKPRDRSRPVFLDFVSEGADEIVREMVENLSGCLKTRHNDEQQTDAWKEEMYNLLRYTDESNASALLLATDGCYLKTVDLLLRHDSRLADLGTLMPAVVLSKCTEVFEKIISYREDWINTDTLREAVLARSHKILSTLLARAKLIRQNDLVTSETAQQVVKDKNDPQLWEILKDYCENCYKDQDCMLLHLAVKYRRKDIVTHVVENKEGSALAATLWWDPELKASHYPLWYNSESRGIKDDRVKVLEKKYENLAIKNGGVEQPKTEDDRKTLRKISVEIAKTCQEIRDIIVPVIIKAEKPLKIKQILDQSKVTVDEICLSLSSFNASAHDFILYVKTLTEGLSEQGRIDKSQTLPSQLQRNQRNLSNGIDHNNIDESNVGQSNVDHTVTQTQSSQKRAAEAVKFEKVLRYADFPDLNYYLPCSPDEFRADHEEIKQVLHWLKLEKGVEEIVKIKVDDRLHTPHEDGAVEYCVKQFKVSVLNWRKLDLCLADLDPDQTLRTLHLYSSGNKAVITNWLSAADKGGVATLKKLEKLYVHVVEDVLSEKRANKVKDTLQKELNALNEALDQRWKVCTVKTQRWRKLKVEEFAKDLQEIVEFSFPEIAPYVQQYKDEHEKSRSRKIKICLIDSGVIVVENKAVELGKPKSHIASQIVDGKSFVYEGSLVSPWWHASVPHGTQMASLICAIDPCCQLFVAKVGDITTPNLDLTTAPVTPERVAEAVLWAVSNNVDIITLSLVLTRETEALKGAFQAAYDKGIVVLCSTSDAGKNWKDTWPAKYALRTDGLEPKGFPNILGIGACDKQGYPLDTTQDIGYPYQFKGKDIYVGPIPFVASTDTVTGSSVSTAIAAGVASLILSSYHLAGNEGALTKKWIAVIARFNAMAERDKVDPRYVLLQNIAGPGGFRKGSSLTNALTNIFSKPVDESKGRLC